MGAKKHPQKISPRRVAEAIERRHEAEALDWLDRGWSIFAGQEDAGGFGWASGENALGLMAHFGGWSDFLKKNEAKIRAQSDFDPERRSKHFFEPDGRLREPAAFSETPLHIAAKRANMRLCQLLLEWGANPNRLAFDSRGRENAPKITPLGMAQEPSTVLALLGGGAKEALCQGSGQGFSAWMANSSWSLADLARARELGADPLGRRDENGAILAVKSALDHASGARLRLLKEWGARPDDFLCAAGGAAGLARWIADAVAQRRVDALRAGSEAFAAEVWADAWGLPLARGAANSGRSQGEHAVGFRKQRHGDATQSVSAWMLCALPQAGIQTAAIALASGFDPAAPVATRTGSVCSGWAALVGSISGAAAEAGKNGAQTAGPCDDASLPLWLAGQKGFNPAETGLGGEPLGHAILSLAASARCPQPARAEGLLRVMRRLAKRNWAPNEISPDWKRPFTANGQLGAAQWGEFEQAFAHAQANALGQSAKAGKAIQRQKRKETGEKTPLPKRNAKRL